MTMLAPGDEDPPKAVDGWGDSQPCSERDLRAWRRTIDHLNERGLTPMGVPLDVVAALDWFSDPFGDALSDDHLRSILQLWGTA